MTYRIEFDPSAEKEMAGLHPDRARQVAARIAALATEPRPRGSEILKGNLRGIRRLRVGAYRVSYVVDDDAGTVRILAIGPRGAFYERMTRR